MEGKLVEGLIVCQPRKLTKVSIRLIYYCYYYYDYIVEIVSTNKF